MASRRIAGPAGHDDGLDAPMGNTISITRPRSWDEVTTLGAARVHHGTTINTGDVPEWVVLMMERMSATEGDIKKLIEAAGEGAAMNEQLQQMKGLYQEMAQGMQKAYDILAKKGDLDQEVNLQTVTRLVQASNEFAGQVWKTIGDLATDAKSKEAANQAAAERLNQGIQTTNAILEAFAQRQREINREIERWAFEKNTRDAIRQQDDEQRDRRIEALCVAEETHQQRLLDYEEQREEEKLELVNKVISLVMSKIQKKENFDAKSLTEAMHEEMTPKPPSLGRAPEFPLPPSEDGSPDIGRGNGGGKPPGGRIPPPPPPPSDPSDDEDSDDEYIRKALERKRQERKEKQKQKERNPEAKNATEAFLESLVKKLQQSEPVGPKRPKMPEMKAPQFFSGKDKTLFRTWWMSVKDYIETYTKTFPDEDDQVKWVGSLLTHKALSWHQERRKSIQRQGLRDTWVAFSSAIETRFEDRREAQKDVKRITELQYDGDIDDYITKLEDLNMRVGAIGPMYRNVIWEAMTPAIKKMVYQRCGGIPTDDEEMIDAVKDAAHVVEELDEELKGSKKKTLEVREDRTKDKNKHKETVRPKQEQHKDKFREKKDKKVFAGKKSEKPAVYASGREALQGVPQTEIDKHKKEKADCWRCGRSGHKMYDCYAKKTVGGSELTKDGKVASSGKRKRDDEEQEKPKEKKKAKTAAVRQDNEDMDMPDAQPRIWELEEDQNMESDF